MFDLTRWPNADDIIEQALARPVEERHAFVRELAAGDADLIAALDAVLAEAETDDGFLEPGGAMAGAVAGDLAATGGEGESPRLEPGTRFGSYEVIGVIGRGGMGEVYRARDPRLGREVALKVLPSRFAADTLRTGKLEREARLLAALNHPHIASIYDLEEHQGVIALVLELVDGPTLSDRIRRGRLGLDESLAIGAQIADALTAAHQGGVVHRDLKPSNIKLTATGDVKVLDFGIAKASDAERGRDLIGSHLPAFTVTGEQGHGGIVGTAPYISPEHARGQATDHRTDIWSFGCVMYEMLTGRRAFDGETSTDVIARVLERDPDFSKLPRMTPPSLRRLLERCFRKDPAMRLGYVGDALLEIQDAQAELAGRAVYAVQPSEAWRGIVLAGALALVIGIAGGAGAMWNALRADPPPPTFLAVSISDEDDLIAGELPGVAISPDGRTIVYRARRDGVIQLVRRSLDADGDDVKVIPSSQGGAAPFFSPDGLWIGFSVEEQLMKVAIDADRPVPLTATEGGSRGSWNADDNIIFSTGTGRVLYRVSATGGGREPVTTLDADAGHLSHESPFVLPDGRQALLTINKRDGQAVGVANLETGVVTELTPGRQPQYLSPGYLVLVRDSALWAARFDVASASLIGEPVQMVDGIELGSLNGTAHYGLSTDGSLIYLPQRPAVGSSMPVWLERDGSIEALPVEAQAYTRASLAPDGTRIAFALSGVDRDIWVYDLTRNSFMRLTLDPATDTAPVWTPDSRRVAFRSERDGGGIFLTNADGSGTPVRLTRADGPSRPAHTPYAFTPDGLVLLFTELRSYTDQGIGSVRLDSAPAVDLLIDGPYAETRPALSPDGSWVAYQSDENGRFEVFVRPYPGVDQQRLQISTAGGTSPRWSSDGGEIYYHDGTSLVAATLDSGPPLAVAGFTPLFEATQFNQRLGPIYDVSPDGQRFLFLRPGGASGLADRRTDLRLIQHWSRLLEDRLGPAR